MSEDQKRRYPRMKIQGKRRDNSSYPFNDTIQNISGSGCFVQTENKFAVGDKYELSVHDPVTDEIILLPGTIVWEYNEELTDAGKTLHGYGIQFDNDSREMARKVVTIAISYRVSQKT